MVSCRHPLPACLMSCGLASWATSASKSGHLALGWPANNFTEHTNRSPWSWTLLRVASNPWTC